MKKEETLIQDEIIDYLNGHEILHWRISNANNMAGFPDILCCYNGIFLALEIKTPTGKPTEQQSKVIDDINDSHGVARIVRSIEDVIEALDDAWCKYIHVY